MVDVVHGNEDQLVPRTKDDIERLEQLRRHVQIHGFDRAVVSQLPALLTWLADPHWDVALPLGEILSDAGDVLADSVRSILGGTDACHQLGLMSLLLRHLPVPLLALWKVELESIASRSDEEGAAESAGYLLQRLEDHIV